MAVLYRKYRPQTFSQVLGQKPIVRTLQNQVKTGQVAHAYLFTGSRGIGKTSLARILAKAVNCKNQTDGDACGKCDICKAVEQGNFLDLVEIDAASNTGVDNIRDLIEHVKFSPSLGKFKVFIIDEVHMLSKGAFNALLKTLEEPPRHAIFILATTEIGKVPATIVSRTQRFDFKRFSSEEISQLLEQTLKGEDLKLDKDVVRLISDNAEGSGRDALSLLDKVLTLGQTANLEEAQQLLGITDFKSCQQLLELIVTGDMVNIPQFFEQLLEKGTDFIIFNRDFLEFLRKVLIYQVTNGQLTGVSKDHESELKELARKTNSQELIFITRLFLKSFKDLATSPRGETPLLLASLEAAQKKSVNQLVSQSVGKLVEVKQPSVTISHKSELKSEVPELSIVNETPVSDTATLVEVRLWWPKAIEVVKKQNNSVANLMKTAVLQEVEDGAIILGLKFSLHRQLLENHKNQELIRGALAEVSGKRLAVRGNIIRPDPAGEEASKVSIGDALQVFGGELIE